MADYEICDKCGYSLLHPSFLVCPICGERREPEPFVVTFGITVNSVSDDEAKKRAQELLDILKEKEPDSSSWIESVDALSESDKMDYFTNAELNEGEGD